MKIKFRKTWILSLVAFYIILFINITFSNISNPFETPKTCSDVFGNCGNSGIDDAFPPCNGTQSSSSGWPNVKEVYINASSFFYGDGINVTCEFVQNQEPSGPPYHTYFEYVWYWNSSNWISIQNWTNENYNQSGHPYDFFNRSVVFVPNSTTGTHIVRCILHYNTTGGSTGIPAECANSTYSSKYDNDDVNFTVTDYLRYTFWNLTNSTTSEAGSGGTYNRSVNLTISAGWNKNISYATVEHNGTGTWVNYTVSPSGNWTNYTLDLSNATQFNNRIIGIRSIYANDTYSLNNNTSPLMYFYLDPGIPPNVTSLDILRGGGGVVGVTNANLFDSDITFQARVMDDVSLSNVYAEINYPISGIKINATMTGSNTPGQDTYWTFTFNNTIPLNETGNYTIRAIAIDIGGQEKASGIDGSCQSNKTLTVNNTYTLTDLSHSTYNRGENITIIVQDVHGDNVTVLNWTVNLTKFNQSEPVIVNGQNSAASFQINNTDPVGNYTMFVNVSKSGNSGNRTYDFNVSNVLNASVSASVSSPTLRGITITVNVSVYNARSTLFNSTFAANISCHNSSNLYAMSPLSFSSSNASFTCYSPTDYSTDYNITVNVTEAYNNTGITIINLTTESAPSGGTTPGGGGGGGGGGGNITIIQNVTVNGTLITRDFNFTVKTTEIQVYRGEDATIVGSVSNSGNTNLTLSSSIFLNSTCCIVSMIPKEFNLNVGGSEIPFTVSIHVNTSTEPDKEYFFDIKLKSESLEKSKRIKIIVKENPVISSIQQVSGQISEIENKIKEYKKVGLNVVDLEGLLNKIKQTLSGSQININKDDINTLKTNENSVKLSLAQINDQLNKLAFVKIIYENKWNILTTVITTVITSYIAIQVVYPYIKLGKEIIGLNEEEQSLTKTRQETEKQYFMRRIDEKTFSGIMIEKQGKILKIRADIKRKSEDRSSLMRQRLHPLAMLRWFKGGILKASTSIKSLPRKIKEKMKIKEVLVS